MYSVHCTYMYGYIRVCNVCMYVCIIHTFMYIYIGGEVSNNRAKPHPPNRREVDAPSVGWFS